MVNQDCQESLVTKVKEVLREKLALMDLQDLQA